MITYSSNTDTSTTVRNMFPSPSPSPAPRLRIVLETDAPYMVPAPIYTAPGFATADAKGKKLPLCHSGMVPWTAEFVADLLPKGGNEEGGWDAARVMSIARENARAVYGV